MKCHETDGHSPWTAETVGNGVSAAAVAEVGPISKTEACLL